MGTGLKDAAVRLGVGVAISAAVALFFTWARAPHESDADESPKPTVRGVLTEHSQFTFRVSEGRIETLHEGTAVETKDDPDFARLTMRVAVSEDGTGTLLDSTGAKTIELERTHEAYTFRDDTPTGHSKELTIFNEWLPDKGGFRARYVTEREVAGVGGSVVLRATYEGYARPEE